MQKETTLVPNDENVKLYTGLSNIIILDVLFLYISNSITSSSSSRSALTKNQMISLTLMTSRLNLMIKDLTYRFNVEQPQVIDVFFFLHLKPVIKYPYREQIWKRTPVCFRKHFGTNIVVILGCFEIKIFISKPQNTIIL